MNWLERIVGEVWPAAVGEVPARPTPIEARVTRLVPGELLRQESAPDSTLIQNSPFVSLDVDLYDSELRGAGKIYQTGGVGLYYLRYGSAPHAKLFVSGVNGNAGVMLSPGMSLQGAFSYLKITTPTPQPKLAFDWGYNGGGGAKLLIAARAGAEFSEPFTEGGQVFAPVALVGNAVNGGAPFCEGSFGNEVSPNTAPYTPIYVDARGWRKLRCYLQFSTSPGAYTLLPWVRSPDYVSPASWFPLVDRFIFGTDISTHVAGNLLRVFDFDCANIQAHLMFQLSGAAANSFSLACMGVA